MQITWEVDVLRKEIIHVMYSLLENRNDYRPLLTKKGSSCIYLTWPN